MIVPTMQMSKPGLSALPSDPTRHDYLLRLSFVDVHRTVLEVGPPATPPEHYCQLGAAGIMHLPQLVVGVITVPTSEMRTWRPRKVMSLAQGHMVRGKEMKQ